MVDLSSKGPDGLNLLSASEAAAKIAGGEITSEALVTDCLARIEARDPEVHAWAFLDRELALTQARARDGEAPRGPLHGIPVGVKDILDTADMPTEYGSSLYRGNQPTTDCGTVAALRRAGAVILGKMVTTEFACPFPAHTLNPHDPVRTPGVSSSGSAASVADFMVPLSNGTQTGGSVIRPAAVCGIHGYKGSLNALDPTGIPMWKPNIDTLGHFGRGLADIALMRAALTGREPASLELPDDYVPRIGICRTAPWPKTTPENIAMIDAAIRILRDAGVTVDDLDFPVNYDEVLRAHGVIVGRDSIEAQPPEVADNLDRVNPWTRDRTREAEAIGDSEVEEAGKVAEAARQELVGIFETYDLLLTASAEGEAFPDITAMPPPPSFNSLWTLMYTPCVSLPAFAGPNDMPVGLQTVGPRDQDDRTLAVSAWVETRLAESAGGLPSKL